MMVWERKKERKKEEQEDRVFCEGMVTHFPTTYSNGLQDERIAGGEFLHSLLHVMAHH
jgi:hypothetical protein